VLAAAPTPAAASSVADAEDVPILQVPAVALVSPTASFGGEEEAEEDECTRSMAPPVEVAWQPRASDVASPTASSVLESCIAPEEQFQLVVVQEETTCALYQGVSRAAQEYDFRSEAVDINDDLSATDLSHISVTKELDQQLSLSGLAPQDFPWQLMMPSIEGAASSVGDECISARSAALPQDHGPLQIGLPSPSGCPTASLIGESQGRSCAQSAPSKESAALGVRLNAPLLALGSACGSASEVCESEAPSQAPGEAPGSAVAAGAGAGGGRAPASQAWHRGEGHVGVGGLLSPPMAAGSTLSARGLGRLRSKEGGRATSRKVAAPSKDRLEPLAESPTPPARQPADAIREASPEAEEKTKKEADEQAKREAEARAKNEAEEKAKREAEAKAKREAEETAKSEAGTQVSEDDPMALVFGMLGTFSGQLAAGVDEEEKAAEKTQKEADEKAKREAEAKAKSEAEEKAKREAEAKAKQEAEETAKRDARSQVSEDAAVDVNLNHPMLISLNNALLAPHSTCDSASDVCDSEMPSRRPSLGSCEAAGLLRRSAA